MEKSILNSVKKSLGIEIETIDFDSELVIFINSVISSLVQLGIGPQEGYTISGASETWADFIGEDKRLESIKTYIYLKVRIIFDPPASSAILDAYKQQIQEFEWRCFAVKDLDRIDN